MDNIYVTTKTNKQYEKLNSKHSQFNIHNWISNITNIHNQHNNYTCELSYKCNDTHGESG